MSCTDNVSKVCCFFGHRTIHSSADLEKMVFEIIEQLIVSNGVSVFMFGSKSQFNDLCHRAVTELREKYPHISRIYVRAEFPHISVTYEQYLLQQYEKTYYPPEIIRAGRAVYVERNYRMIDKSDFCVVYFDESYLPKSKTKSGTRLALDYAVTKDKTIINVVANDARAFLQNNLR